MATKIVTKNSSTAGAAPTATDLVQGELAVNVADGRLYTEDNAAAIVELGVNPATEITANAGIALPDSQKATFGAGDDLQIYHDGSNSWIQDLGTGNLVIRGTNLNLQKVGGESYITMVADGAVTAFYDNGPKLATTSTGIDVTGIASVTGSNQHALTIKSNVGTGSYEVGRNQSTGLLEFKGTEATYNGYLFKGPSSDLMTINASGNVGVGTSSPSGLAKTLNIDGGSGGSSLALDGGDNFAVMYTGATVGDPTSIFSNTGFKFATATSKAAAGFAERMRIDSSGNVGIGVTSAPSRLTVKSPDNTLATNIAQFDSLNGGAGFKFGYQRIEQIGATVPITFETGGSESMRIDSSGNVGIGITPATLLDIKEGTAATDAIIGLTAGTGGRAQIRSEAQADNTSSELSFHTMGGSSTAERMRIDSSGNLLVGTTASTARLAVKSNAGAILGFGVYGDTAGDTAYNIAQFGKFDNNTTTSQVFVNFVVNNGAAANGQINANGSGAVAFGSWSDSRLKENITDLPNQLANITALRPVEFDYIESEGGGHQLGFIAQEVEEIYPDLVGERQDGMKTLSGLSKWDARLVKAIQEQQTLIESLTTRIAALEE